MKDTAIGGRAFAEYAHVVAQASDVLIGLHTDHATHDQFDDFVLPLIEGSRRRRGMGREPLFNSHMFDGSTLPLDENLAYARRCSRSSQRSVWCSKLNAAWSAAKRTPLCQRPVRRP